MRLFRPIQRTLPVALFAILALSGVPTSAQLQTTPGQPQVTSANEKLIVTFRPGTSQADREASVRRAGATLRFNYTIVDAVAVTANVNAVGALQRDINVLEIIPDRPVQAFQSPEVVGNGRGGKGGGGGNNGGGGTSPQPAPEGVKRVGIPTAASNGSGIGVAIVDTGMDFAHADLQDGAISNASFSAFGDSCQDDNGHGTHVAGIVGARNNTIDALGVAPNSTLYCVKVLNAAGSGSDSDIMAGLNWVYQHRNDTPNIRVVNMSLGRSGTPGDNPAMWNVFQTLRNAGIAVVVAAGNDSSAEVNQTIPAGYPEVIAVASTSAGGGSNAGCRFFSETIPADTASYFTTDGAFDAATGIGVTISAPGEDKEDVNKACFIKSSGILSLKLGGGTTRMSGTSMASPHVAGIVARLIQTMGYGGNQNPGYALDATGVEAIRSDLRSHADAAGAAPLDSPTSSYTFDNVREGIAQAP